MKTVKYNWVKIGIGASLLWYSILRGAKALIVKLHSFSFKSVDIANMTVSLDLNIMVKNPLLVGIKLQSITGNVFIQGVKVGAVNTILNYKISGGKTHIIPIIVNLNISELGTAAWANIQSGDIKTLNIAFDGKLLVGDYGFGIPLKFNLDYNDLTK